MEVMIRKRASHITLDLMLGEHVLEASNVLQCRALHGK